MSIGFTPIEIRFLLVATFDSGLTAAPDLPWSFIISITLLKAASNWISPDDWLRLLCDRGGEGLIWPRDERGVVVGIAGVVMTSVGRSSSSGTPSNTFGGEGSGAVGRGSAISSMVETA